MSLLDVVTDLETIARFATPGPWLQTHDLARGVKLWGADRSPLFLSIGGLAHSRVSPEAPVPQWQHDCDYVRACSPNVILELCASVRQGMADTRRLDAISQPGASTRVFMRAMANQADPSMRRFSIVSVPLTAHASHTSERPTLRAAIDATTGA